MRKGQVPIPKLPGGVGIPLPIGIPTPSPSHGKIVKAPPRMPPIAMPPKNPNSIY